jgi:NADPH-dependent curcumin reductase CurA
MQGATVGEVVESKHPKFPLGTQLVNQGGWQEYGLVDALDARAAARRRVTIRPNCCRSARPQNSYSND